MNPFSNHFVPVVYLPSSQICVNPQITRVRSFLTAKECFRFFLDYFDFDLRLRIRLYEYLDQKLKYLPLFSSR